MKSISFQKKAPGKENKRVAFFIVSRIGKSLLKDYQARVIFDGEDNCLELYVDTPYETYYVGDFISDEHAYLSGVEHLAREVCKRRNSGLLR